jgi:hypothetical protein
MSEVDAKPLAAIDSIPLRSLLLLLLLLAGGQHPPLRQRDRLAQHVKIADMIGQDQDQRGIEIGALFVVQSAMSLDNSAKCVVRLGKI